MSDRGQPDNSSNKRKHNYHQGKMKYQPKRGGPAMIITCETGRDGKAKREGMDMIRYYYNQQQSSSSSNVNGNDLEVVENVSVNTKPEPAVSTLEKAEEGTESSTEKFKDKAVLSLDNELALLKSDNNSNASKGGSVRRKNDYSSQRNGPFSVYETGCRGTVFVMCTHPNCSLIPKVNTSQPGETEEEGPTKKKTKTEEVAQSDSTGKGDAAAAATTTTTESCGMHNNGCPPWDPVAALRQIMKDIHEECQTGKSKNGAPASRFVTRMLPVQATCFASLEEITATFRALLDHVLLPKLRQQQQQTISSNNDTATSTTTFGIRFKKRNCGNVNRDQVIDAIVLQVDDATKETWKVDLDKPDYRVEVQICKTLCGISILNEGGDDAFICSRKFNLAELRVEAATAAGSCVDAKKDDAENVGG